ncbi:putative Lsg locus protein 1 [Vibrio owensii]|uniref:Lsg locus protein 1 n=1 Tax=Vibrio owensii TaxID=696485 RepID=A0AAU9Q8D7_9VIBR|nr:putative Lsg locus protein 1 [Vibrio owensii]
MSAIKDGVVYTIGELIKKLIPFLLLPYLSRNLGTEGFGELAFVQIFISLFVVIVGLSQAAAVSRYYYRYGENGVINVIVSGYLYSSLISIFLLVPLLIMQQYMIAIALLISLFQELLSSQLSIRQCKKKAIEYTLINISVAMVSVILTVALFEFYEATFENRLISMLVAYFIVWIVSSVLLHKSKVTKLTKFRISLGFKYICSFGLPLIVHQLSIFSKGQLDRLFIGSFYSISELGIYSAAFQVSLVISVVIMAINKALIPYLYSSLKNKKINIEWLIKASLWSFLIIPIPSLITLLIPEKYYLIALGSEFVGVKFFIVVFILGQMSLIPYLILINYYFYHGRTKKISQLTLVTTILYMIFLFVFGRKELEYLPFGLMLCNLLPVFAIYFSQTKKMKLKIS